MTGLGSYKSRRDTEAAGEEGALRIATHERFIGKREGGEDGRAAKCGGRLEAAFIAVADVDGEGFGKGGLEGYGSAL